MTLATSFRNAAGSVPNFDSRLLTRLDGVSDDVFRRMIRSDRCIRTSFEEYG